MPRVPGPGPIVLDGGFATELEARGHDLRDRLWSARLLMTEPQAIEDVHLAYYRSGARVATTATYQATVPGFAAVGLDRAAALAAIARSVRLAQAARERAEAEDVEGDGGRLVAGSVGPYATVLADGSEYRGDYDPGPAVLREVHAPRIDALLEAGADLLAIETIPTIREAEVLVRLVEERHAPAWLSYQCRDGRSTAAGEPIADAIAIAEGAPDLVAVGVNCTSPIHVPALLAAAAAVTSRALIAYPNGGDTWDPVARRWSEDPAAGGFDAVAVATWTDLGAQWLGGCCRTGPADIAALARTLADRETVAS